MDKNGFLRGKVCPIESRGKGLFEPIKANEILTDQIKRMGCLSQCRFSNWAQNCGLYGVEPRSR